VGGTQRNAALRKSRGAGGRTSSEIDRRGGGKRRIYDLKAGRGGRPLKAVRIIASRACRARKKLTDAVCYAA
jgi:hypothetical protein